MYIHKLLPSSEVNGPGNRAVVWFQGCELHCPGCWNPETHSLSNLDPDLLIKPEDLLEWCCQQVSSGRNGVTFSGGEPMHQAFDLKKVVEGLRMRVPYVSIGMYTGYSERELNHGQYFVYVQDSLPSDVLKDAWEGIKKHLDFAVMGRYNKYRPSSFPMLSSSNQRLELFSRRHRIEDFEPQQFEVNIDEQALVQVTGFPPAPAKQIFGQ